MKRIGLILALSVMAQLSIVPFAHAQEKLPPMDTFTESLLRPQNWGLAVLE